MNDPLPSAPQPRVILVVADADRCDVVRTVVAQVLPGSRVELSESVIDATLRSIRLPADLLVLDFALDGASAPALIRHLGRVAPSTSVLVFDDIDEPRAGHPHDVWPWADVEKALLRWIDSLAVTRSFDALSTD